MDPEATPIGWVGTGVMGGPMCGHLIDAGHPVTVHTRTRERAAELLDRGARWAPSPRQAADGAAVVVTMVGSPADVREVVLGDDGVLTGAGPGTVLVDMTTSEPSLAAEIAEAARARGVGAVDAPVSGGDVGARNATLSIMVGGDDDAVGQARPILDRLGRTIVHQGPPGAGQHTKAVNQLLVAGVLAGLSEGLVYAHRAGLDLEHVLRSVSVGAAGSWSLDNYGPRILSGDLEPGFAVEHFVKDLSIALREAERMDLAVPASAVAHQLYLALRAQGDGGRGVHALPLALARLSHVAWDA